MLTGTPLYKKPHKKDAYFCNLINGYLPEMINQWDLNQFVSKNAFDLLFSIFKPENKRLTMKQILNHPYITQTE